MEYYDWHRSHACWLTLAGSQYPARKYSYGDMWCGGKLFYQHSSLPTLVPDGHMIEMIDFKQPAQPTANSPQSRHK